MQVQKVNNSVYPNQELPSPNFKAKGLDPEIIRAVTKDSKAFNRFLIYAGEKQGEALNILVTAFGTAIICPMFIRFNPFSKEDKQTRAYSAWRQPISAIIAVAAQLTITKWFNNLLSMKASTNNKQGKANYNRADLRACPHERYLKRIVKLEHPDWSKEAVEKEVKKRQVDVEKHAITEARKTYINKHFEIRDLLCQDNMEAAKKEIFGELKTEFKTEIEGKFGKPVEDVGSRKLNRFLEGKLQQKAAAAGKDKVALVSERAEKMLEKEINSETVIKFAFNRLRSKNRSIEKAIEMCNEDQVLNFIQRHDLEKTLGEYNIKDLTNEILRKLHNEREWNRANGLPDWASKKFLGNTPEEIKQSIKIKKWVKGRNSDAKRVFKTMNTQLGLIVTLATLPITCGILNWAYPRIMEKIMPEMAAKKKASSEPVNKEGGDK